MPTIGEQLKASRRACKLSIDDLSEATKIRPYLLRCLEDGEFEKFPDKFRLVSFLRQYAGQVGIDQESAVAAALEYYPEPDEEAPSDPPLAGGFINGRAISSIADEGRRSLGKVATVVVAVVLVAVGSYWGIDRYRPATAMDRTSDPTTAVASAVRAADSEQAEAAGENAPATTNSTPAGAMTLEILATETVWLRSIADGRATREVTLYRGDRHRVVADQAVQVLFGNAGGVELLIDGVPQRKVGESGEVRRIRVTPDGWSHIASSSR